MNKKAIVIFSGGQDSTSCLFYALEKGYDEILALTFDYNQRNKKEVQVAKDVINKIKYNFNYDVEFRNFRHKVLEIDLFKNITSSMTQDIDIEEGEDYPNTFVPGRNALFLNIAGSFAYENNIHDIIIGVNQEDYSGYPDCRDTFIRSMEYSLSLALDYKISIITPLIHLSKKRIWEFVYDMSKGERIYKFIRFNTLTCYNGIIGEGCGECPACKLRKKGLEKFEKSL